ncbi:MAG: YraN family protein [Geminocystis sp.]|nr:YraN family protein [Geminocystis sp.]
MIKIGRLGEEIVSQWLEGRGCRILYRNWHCIWGEIDLIGWEDFSNTLVFVEVKTRKTRKNCENWNNSGILAVNQQKEKKLRLVADKFLFENPSFAEKNCRFDVVIVEYEPASSSSNWQKEAGVFYYQGCEFKIVDYIANAL